MGDLLLSAFALMLIFDGLLPFLSPSSWRSFLERVSKLSDGQIRFFGLTSMVIGLFLLLIWR